MPNPPTHRRRLVALAGIVCLGAVVATGWSVWSRLPRGVPQSVEFDRSTLSPRMTSATVLALGEATHGTHEFQALRLELLQRVVGAGFTTVALEEDFGCVAAVDAWVQGGPGTAEEALHRFGYAISRTREMVDLLSWVRHYNADRSKEQRVHLVGLDVQRPDADKALALGWLTQHEPEKARTLAGRLASLTDASRLGNEVAADVPGAINELADAITATDDGSVGASDALHAAHVLLQDRTLAANWSGPTRDRFMFDNLSWLVERGARTGRSHTLLFAHDGHLDRAGQATAAGLPTIGSLAAAAFGDSYRVIGTDAHHVRFLSGDSGHREEFAFAVDSAYRGMFAGTAVGYLELQDARGPNVDVVQSQTLMASAGEQFVGWYALLPTLHSVHVIPAQAWDAVIYVEDSTPVTMAG